MCHRRVNGIFLKFKTRSVMHLLSVHSKCVLGVYIFTCKGRGKCDDLSCSDPCLQGAYLKQFWTFLL